MDDLSIFSNAEHMKMDRRHPSIDLYGVGSRMKAVRIASGLAARDFAETVDIDPSSLSKIETGKKALNADMGYRVSLKWGVSMDFLYRGRLNDTPDKILAALRSIENHREE